MRTLFYSLFYFLFAAQICLAQWEWKNPLPQGNTLNGVHFIDDNVGWAIGNKGYILKTSDGGINWVSQNSNTFARLSAVQFLNATVGYVVGDSGVILKTTNGGESWNKLTSSYNYWISSLHFVNENYGWLGAGNYILATTNGGSTWQNYYQAAPFIINGVFFLSQTNGFWVGFGGVNKTTDGGLTFSSLSGLPYCYDWDDIFFLNNNLGWIVGEGGKVIKTTDGGNNWNEVSNVSGYNDKIFFLDESNGWIASGYDGIYRTQDGGNSWQLTSIKNIRDVFYYQNAGFIVGAGGKIFKSVDLGESWQYAYQNLMPDKRFNSIYFNDPAVGFAVGDSGRIFKTENGGINWIQQTCPTASDLTSVFFTDINTGWISGYQVILKTTNSGDSWTLKYTSNYENIFDMFFHNSQIGWAVGDKIMKTINGGNIWNEQVLPNVYGQYFLKGIHFVNESQGFTVGPAGWYFKTINGGDNWEKITLPTSVDLNEIKFYDNSTGWIVGGSGTILKTTDGGSNWDIQNFENNYSLFDLHIIDSQTIWAVGGISYSDYGSITLYTKNGGDTWVKIKNPNTQCIYRTFFTDKNQGWAVGDQGSILTYSGTDLIPEAPCNLIASAAGDKINLVWTDNSQNEDGFEILRSDNYSGNYKKIASINTDKESYIDSIVKASEIFWYRVRAFNGSGYSAPCCEDSARALEPVSADRIHNEIPSSYNLHQNYPNPFNPSTKISWQSPVGGHQTMNVFDVLGNEIATLVNEYKPAGTYEVTWNAANLPSGVYFYQLQAVPIGRQAGEYTAVKKMLLIK